MPYQLGKQLPCMINGSCTAHHLCSAAFHARQSLFCVFWRGMNQLCHTFSSLLWLLCQLAHLLCHHSKSTPLLSCPGSLNSCIKRQKIGLGSDIGNSLYNIANLLRMCPQGCHSGLCLTNPGIYAFHLPDSLLHSLLVGTHGSNAFVGSLPGICNNAIDACNVIPHTLHRSHCINHLIFLLLGTWAYKIDHMRDFIQVHSRIFCRSIQLLTSGRYLLGHTIHLLYHLPDIPGHFLHRPAKVTNFIILVIEHLHIEVALRHRLCPAHEPAYRRINPPVENSNHHNANQNNNY